MEVLASAGRAPRVLIVPGLNGYPGMLTAAAPALFPGLRPLPFDHRLDLAEDGIEGLAERALGLLDDDPEGAAPAYVCGESFGGTVALWLAKQQPERVRGLILLSTFGHYPPLASAGGQAALTLWRFLGSGVGSRAFNSGRLASVPAQLGFRFSRDVAMAYLRRPAAWLPGYRRKCQLSLGFDARPWLGSLTCPAFVLVGSWDPVVPTSAGVALARAIPRATLHRLPGGHLVHLVRAAQAGALIKRWRVEVEAAQPAAAVESAQARPGPPPRPEPR